MRLFCSLALIVATMLAVSPAAAQRYDPRYPVCLQRWLREGIIVFDCSYTNWDQCRATASGLSATCLDNPYWQGLRQEAPRRSRPRRY